MIKNKIINDFGYNKRKKINTLYINKDILGYKRQSLNEQIFNSTTSSTNISTNKPVNTYYFPMRVFSPKIENTSGQQTYKSNNDLKELKIKKLVSDGKIKIMNKMKIDTSKSLVNSNNSSVKSLSKKNNNNNKIRSNHIQYKHDAYNIIDSSNINEANNLSNDISNFRLNSTCKSFNFNRKNSLINNRLNDINFFNNQNINELNKTTKENFSNIYLKIFKGRNKVFKPITSALVISKKKVICSEPKIKNKSFRSKIKKKTKALLCVNNQEFLINEKRCKSFDIINKKIESIQDKLSFIKCVADYTYSNAIEAKNKYQKSYLQKKYKLNLNDKQDFSKETTNENQIYEKYEKHRDFLLSTFLQINPIKYSKNIYHSDNNNN